MNSNRNLSVPYFSQRENQYIWKEKYIANDLEKNRYLSSEDIGQEKSNGKTVSLAATSCNITCLAMILQYFGITTEKPDDIMKNIYEPAGEGEYVSDEIQELREQTYNNYSKIEEIDFLADIVRAFYPEAQVITSHLKKGLDYVEQHVANGIPVMISCGIARRYSEAYYSDRVKTSNSEIRTIKENYEKVHGSNYDTDLLEAEKNLEEASDEEKPQAQEKVEEIKSRYAQEEQKRLNWYLEYYRHRGHYIVVRGFTEDSVIINDPWGSPINNQGSIQMTGSNMGKGYYNHSPFGDNIKIPRDQFDLQYNENKNLWTTLAIYHYRWGFVLNNNSIPRGVKPDQAMLESCYAQETFDFGGFPMKRNNLWHNGIHIQTGGNVMVYPMGPGQIVAARITDENTELRASDPTALNGSRCFVLVKHQILDGDSSTIQDFYSLYMHLKPQNDFAECVREYPIKTTGISWLDSLLFRSNKFFRISWGKEAVIYRVSDNQQIGTLESSQTKAYDRVEEGKYFYTHSGVSCYSYKIEGNITKLLTYHNYDTDESEFIQKYGAVIQSLADGNITYFNDLPDPNIEVTASTSLGASGTFGGYERDNEHLLHWEVFSSDNLIDRYPNHDMRLIDYDSTQNLGMCNRREMIEMFHSKDAYENVVDQWLYLDEDGVISKKEMTTFYNSPLSHNLRYYICQHKSEWAENIDWEREIDNSVGIAKDGLWLKLKDFLGIDTLNSLSDYVKYVYDPYKWFDTKTVNEMKPIKNTNFKEGNATFYHPISFLHWLYENDDSFINKPVE